jgi:23S rRNA G2445 N2-methylase RlmL
MKLILTTVKGLENIDQQNLKNITEFSITLSLLKSKVSLEKILNCLKDTLKQKIINVQYLENKRAKFDIRLIQNEAGVFVGLRLSEKPLHKRSYKIATPPISLKSTIAAAMLEVLNPKPGEKLLDFFCGGGTILCEGFFYGLKVYGSDIDALVLDSAAVNLETLSQGLSKNLTFQDATKNKYQADSFEIICSNLPWDKQIKVDSITELYKKTLLETKRILKISGRASFLVHKPEIFIKLAKKQFLNKKINQFKLSINSARISLITIY